MSWDVETIRDAIQQTEEARSPLLGAMREYEDAWKLKFWSAAEQAAAAEEGRKLYTSPAPRNIVSLANNLISGRVRVACPAGEGTAEEVEHADLRAQFLEMLIQRQSKVLEMGVVDALGWYAVVRGRMALQIVWIWDLLTPQQRLFSPPILYRPLDPLGVGIERDFLGTKWAYHKYKEKIALTKSRYPEIFKNGLIEADPKATNEVTVTDFWYMEKGSVYNCVLVDGEFAKKVKKTQYPFVPILERNNDPTPASPERWRSGSILEGVLGTWAELNYLHSMHLTSIGRYYWPALYYTNQNNETVPPLDTGMGAVNELPPGTAFIGPANDKPDVQLAMTAIQWLGKDEQDSTFPDVMYGDAGQMRAAYGMNLMASTAVRRIRSTKEQMETLLQGANELALWCVQKYAPGGVDIYGYDPRDKKSAVLSLSSKMVNAHYENSVTIETSVPGAALQELMAGVQLVNNKIISRNTFRRSWIPAEKETPVDEDVRVLIERIEDDPDLLRERLRVAYADYYGVELPSGEPDFKATPPPAPPMPAQPMPPQQMPPPQMQPQQMPPSMGMGGQEFQGGMSPDMMGLDQNDPQTAMMMEMIARGQMPGPTDMANMQGGQFRRR